MFSVYEESINNYIYIYILLQNKNKLKCEVAEKVVKFKTDI